MDRAGCHPPGLDILGGMTFQVILRNQPIYDRATFEWLRQFESLGLSLDQKRVLAAAHSHEDRFTSRDVQALLKTDIYGASALIKDLTRKGAARSQGKGSRVYEVVPSLQAKEGMPEAFVALLPLLQRQGCLRNGDVSSQLRVARNTAWRLLQEWTDAGWLSVPARQRGRDAKYVGGTRLLHQPPMAPSDPEVGAMTSEVGAMKSHREKPPAHD